MSAYALAPGHAREYETIYILRPNLDREANDGVAGRVAEAISGHDGMLTNAELWGQRRLAYPIQRHHRGTYVYVKYLGKGATVAELERQLRLQDAVIRFQTIVLRDNVPVAGVKVDEDDVKLDFDMPQEPDEPELTRERELGLDTPPPERRRRDDRRPRHDEAAEAKADGDNAEGDKAEGDKAEGDKAEGDKAEGDKAEAKTEAKAEAKAEPKAEPKAEAADTKKEGSES
jgi:small subunit ribosomal protein S6